MSIEGGHGSVMLIQIKKPTNILKGKPYSPSGTEWENAINAWSELASDEDCEYDDVVKFDASEIAPTVTWGINPSQAIFINENIPNPDNLTELKKQV